MKVDKTITNKVDSYRLRMKKWLRPFDADLEDIVQDVYVRLLEAPEGTDLHFVIYGTCSDHRRKELNRRRLREENSQAIVKNTTPTLSDRNAGSPEEFIGSEQELRRRWASMSALLRRVAKRSYFGYMESPEKIAKELGMTVAAVNMARTRIKQHMNGVK
jgi:DNA-directed RNA polymerase specialized sigma24 family protein